MRILLAVIGALSVASATATFAADEYVVWSAIKGEKADKVEWKKGEKMYKAEDDAYAEGAKIGKGDGVLEVRVLKSTQPAPKEDSLILAGRVAEIPDIPQIQKAQKYTFNKNGTVTFESGDAKEVFKYTVDGDELWIVWVFVGRTQTRVSDQQYKLTKEGFQIVKSKERSEKDWYEFKGDLTSYTAKFKK